jgi:hypothetical protein
MKNTPYAVDESSSLVESLIGRTEEGKIQWTEGDFELDTSESFSTILDEMLTVSIFSNKSEVRFSVSANVTQYVTRQILAVTLEHDPNFGFESLREGSLHDQLMQLLELARRSALKVDEKLANAREFLQRLAG